MIKYFNICDGKIYDSMVEATLNLAEYIDEFDLLDVIKKRHLIKEVFDSMEDCDPELYEKIFDIAMKWAAKDCISEIDEEEAR